MKTEEQIKSKLSDCKNQLKRWEEEYERKPQDKWLKYRHNMRGRIEMLRWLLEYH